MKDLRLSLLSLVIVSSVTVVGAAPPSAVLSQGGIQSPDGTVLESAAAVVPPDTLTVAPPSVVLSQGGIQFPDGTVLESAAAVVPPDTLTVAVDCDGGDLISDALEIPAKELTIAISGICDENIVIRRDDVTLAGSDAETDGIVGVVTGAEIEPPVVSVLGAVNVGLENLTVANGPRNGVEVYSSRVSLADCVVDSNVRWGVIAIQASNVAAERLLLTSNGVGALFANTGSRMILTDSQLTENGGGQYYSAAAQAASYLYFYDSQISGDYGVQVYMSGFVFGRDTSITATDVALSSNEQGDINWFGGTETAEISGAVQANWKSLLWMANVNQTGAGSGDGNFVDRDSTVFLEDVTLQGLQLNLFSNGDVSGSDLGTVGCGSGSDLYCDGTTVTSSSCGLCPAP